MTTVHLLGIDIGGTMVKAAVFDAAGQMLAQAVDRSDVRPGPGGRAERDPEQMWRSTAVAVRRVLAEPTVDVAAIAAVGVTGYGNGLFLLDERGCPTRSAIASVDTRAAQIVERWRADGLESTMWDTTLQPFWAGQPLALLAWVDRHEPGAIAATSRVVMAKDFVRFRLTGSLRAELTDLGSGGLIDHRTLAPAHRVFDAVGLGHVASLFADDDLLRPVDVAGHVTADASAATGLPVGLPVIAGTFDGLSVLLGSGVRDHGQLSVVAGTWGLHQTLAAAPNTDRVVFQSIPGMVDGEHVLVESNPNSMSNFEWYVNGLVTQPPPGTDVYDHVTALARSASPTSDDPLVFVPHVYATPRHPLRTGAFVGLVGSTGPAEMMRAVFDGIAFEHRTLIERLPGVAADAPVRLAGGAARSPVWSQLLADTTGRTVEIPDTAELGARGAALIAATAVGTYADLDSASHAMTAVAATFAPRRELRDDIDVRFRRFGAWRTMLATPPV